MKFLLFHVYFIFLLIKDIQSVYRQEAVSFFDKFTYVDLVRFFIYC